MFLTQKGRYKILFFDTERSLQDIKPMETENLQFFGRVFWIQVKQILFEVVAHPRQRTYENLNVVFKIQGI